MIEWNHHLEIEPIEKLYLILLRAAPSYASPADALSTNAIMVRELSRRVLCKTSPGRSNVDFAFAVTTACALSRRSVIEVQIVAHREPTGSEGERQLARWFRASVSTANHFRAASARSRYRTKLRSQPAHSRGALNRVRTFSIVDAVGSAPATSVISERA